MPSGKLCSTVALLTLALAACTGGGTVASDPVPRPRDVASPAGLTPELARLRIAWTAGDVQGPTLVNVDGSDPVSVPLPPYAVTARVSPGGRSVVYATGLLPDDDIEALDLETQERTVLVRGRERFPGASLLYPSYAQDEGQVIFEVGSGDRIDLAIVDVRTKEVQFLDLGGGLNKWPRVSPDGASILVVCEAQGEAAFSLCLLDRAARLREHLVEDEVFVGGEFSPDGQTIVYVGVVGGPLGEGRLYRVDPDGGGRSLLVSGLSSGAGVLGVTNQDALFTCSTAEEPACSWVCGVGLDGTDVRRLTYLGKHCIDVSAP